MKKIFILLVIFTFFACSDTEKKSMVTATESTLLPGISKVYVDYQEALDAAKMSNKNMFILFQTEGCRWCKKLKATTLQDPTLIQQLNESFVVLVLDRDKSQYPDQYHVGGVPTVYMVSNKGEIYVERVGYRKDPKAYSKWFEYVKIESGL